MVIDREENQEMALSTKGMPERLAADGLRVYMGDLVKEMSSGSHRSLQLTLSFYVLFNSNLDINVLDKEGNSLLSVIDT